MTDLTPKQALFVQEYLVDLNATRAAVRAGYSAKTAEQQGPRLLGNVGVAAAIKTAQDARSEETGITAARVLQELWEIATADPRELIEWRRTCCRHCWGEGFRHQYTEQEMRTRRVAFDSKSDLGDEAPAWDADGLFDEGGGIGFDARRDPNPECPECFGEGIGQVFVPDIRKLTGPGLRLYAGVKTTKDGLEIKMRSQDAALGRVFEHLGMGVKRFEHSGPGGGPIPLQTDLVARIGKLSPEDREALRAIAHRLDGK